MKGPAVRQTSEARDTNLSNDDNFASEEVGLSFNGQNKGFLIPPVVLHADFLERVKPVVDRCVDKRETSILSAR